MNIAYFVPSPEGKGSYFRAFQFANHLSRKGHQVQLICGNGKPSFNMIRKRTGDVEVILLPAYFDLHRWIPTQIFDAFANSALSLASSPDVVHAFSTMAPSSGLTVMLLRMMNPFLKNCKLFVDWDDWWGRGGILRDYGWIVNVAGTFFEENAPLLGDAVTVVSDVLRRRALSLGVKRVYKIPNGSDFEAIKPMPKSFARKKLGLPKDKFIICHIGFTDLTEAYQLVRKSVPNSLLIIVGQPPKFISLRVPNLKNVKGIIYTGHQPYARVPLYMGASDVLVLKTEDEIADRARWPIRLGDYLAAGRPIITGTGDAAREIHKHKCGYPIKPGDPKDLADKIIEMANRRHLWDEFGKNARALAEGDLSWGKIAKDLEQLYEVD